MCYLQFVFTSRDSSLCFLRIFRTFDQNYAFSFVFGLFLSLIETVYGSHHAASELWIQ